MALISVVQGVEACRSANEISHKFVFNIKMTKFIDYFFEMKKRLLPCNYNNNLYRDPHPNNHPVSWYKNVSFISWDVNQRLIRNQVGINYRSQGKIKANNSYYGQPNAIQYNYVLRTNEDDNNANTKRKKYAIK